LNVSKKISAGSAAAPLLLLDHYLLMHERDDAHCISIFVVLLDCSEASIPSCGIVRTFIVPELESDLGYWPWS